MRRARHDDQARRARRAVTRRRFLVSLVIAFIVLGTYNALMAAFAHKYDDAQPRNRRTGVLRGAEEIDLGPRDAKTAVILVHGFLGAQNNFGELPQRLAAAGFRVRALRLPGHGTTPFDLQKTPPAEMLNYVARQARELETQHENVFLIGHSMGSDFCLLAATFTDIDGVVLGAPHFKVTHFWWYGLPVEWSNLLTSWAVHWVYKSDGFIRVRREEAKPEILSYRYVPTRSARQLDKLAARARDPDTLAMLTCRVLLIHGRLDSASSPREAQRVFANIASDDKTMTLLDQSDHHIYMDYDRDQVDQEIIGWINERS
jgi:carboxylesterase